MADLARRATRCCRYYIPLHVDTNPESLRPFVPEIWPNNVFNLSATYDLDLWPKILKIFVSHGVPIRNMYAKFHNDRLRNGWDITLWNFAKTRTNKHTNKHTNKQTWALQYLAPPPMGGEVNTCWIKVYQWLSNFINIKQSNTFINIRDTISNIFFVSFWFNSCKQVFKMRTHRSNKPALCLSGLRRSRVHSLMIARRSLCPDKLGSNPGQGSKGINLSGWHGLDMSITVTKRR